MAVWKYSCKTVQGKNLDLKLLSREGVSLKLTKAWTGSGKVDPTQLMFLDSVVNPVQQCQLHKAAEYPEQNKIMLPILLKNTSVTEKYDMYQLGVYAEDPDQGEILYLVLQADGAEEVPAYDEMKDFTLEWHLNLSVSNTENVDVIIDPTCYASLGDLALVESRVAEIEESYVEKEQGKGLSSNDFSDTYMNKLKAIEDEAQVNKIEIVKINGTPVEIQEKSINLEVLVARDLENYYTSNQIDQKISMIPKFNIAVVNSLPVSNISSTTVYLLKSGEENQNLYTEYIYVNGGWEKLGSQKIDLSGYSTKGNTLKEASAKNAKTILFTRGDGSTFEVTITGTTYSNMEGATSSAAGAAGLVPAPEAGAQGKYLRGDGKWQTPPDTVKYSGFSGIGDLAAKTTVADTDNMLVGTDKANKITWANIIKAILAKLTGGVSSILTANLTASRALVSDGDGKVVSSSITATVLGYLSGLTANVKNQIDAKLDASKVVASRNITVQGNVMDGKTCSEYFSELIGKSYADGYVFVEFGALPNNNIKSVPFSLPDGVSQCWIENAWCSIWHTVYPMPFATPGDSSNFIGITIGKSDSIVRVVTKADWSNYSGYVVIGYKK